MTTTHTLPTMTATYGITSPPGDDADDWYASADPWTVTLRHNGRQMTVPYWMGSAFNGEPPTIEQVLENLLLSAADADLPFDQWCAEFGYDTDSRKIEKMYHRNRAQTAKLRHVLGDDYEAIAAAYGAEA